MVNSCIGNGRKCWCRIVQYDSHRNTELFLVNKTNSEINRTSKAMAVYFYDEFFLNRMFSLMCMSIILVNIKYI